MSIESAIENAQQKVANAYTAVENKGGTLPATQNLSNLPTAINTISTAGTVEQLNVTPTTSAQTFTASGDVDGYNPVNVSAVTSEIDSDIKATNIKSGVTILGVTGSVTELAGETRSVSLTNSAGQTFTPTNGKNGITSITVTPNNQARSVTPTTSQQSLTVNSGYSGNGTITVNAVTSAIDPNIVASNIKKDVVILGITGTYEGSGGGGGTSYIVTNVTDEGSNQNFSIEYDLVAQALLSGDYTPEPTFYEEDGDTFIEDVTWRDTNDNEVTMTEIIEQATGNTGWSAEIAEIGENSITYLTPYDMSGFIVGVALYFSVTIGEAT